MTTTAGSFLRDFAAFAGVKGLRACAVIFLGAVVEGIGLVLLIPLVTVITDGPNAVGWAHTATAWLFGLLSLETRFTRLTLLVGLFAMLLLARAVILTARDVLTARLGVGFIQHIRSRVTRRLATARWDVVARLRHSRVTHLMGADILQVSAATSLLLRDVVAVVMLVSQVVLACLLSPLLTAVAFGLVLTGAATLRPTLRRAREFGTFVTGANLGLINDMTQFLGAVKLAISQNLQKRFISEFEHTLDNLTARQVRYTRQYTATRMAVATASGLAGVAAVLVGIVVLDIAPPVLITLLVIFARMSAPATQLYLDAHQLAAALPAYDKLRELERDLALADTAMPGTGSPAVAAPGGPVTFHGVSFLHGPDGGDDLGTAGGIRDLDLVIAPGCVVGVTGPSGAGKTTFADLLVGLYPPQSGEILIGGVALRGPSIAAWRDVVGYVAQDGFLFHDTVRRNLLWARPDADEAELWEALRATGADRLVRGMTGGLDTVVGERGTLVSGGERQRLSLARAILRRPKLLVLDEATSAIDVASEETLLDRLLHIAPRPTIVMIAHRLDSLRRCQRLFVLESGRLVLEGPAESVIGRLRDRSPVFDTL
jgi:ATP-binding cassette subfamily C protein